MLLHNNEERKRDFCWSCREYNKTFNPLFSNVTVKCEDINQVVFAMLSLPSRDSTRHSCVWIINIYENIYCVKLHFCIYICFKKALACLSTKNYLLLFVETKGYFNLSLLYISYLYKEFNFDAGCTNLIFPIYL